MGNKVDFSEYYDWLDKYQDKVINGINTKSDDAEAYRKLKEIVEVVINIRYLSHVKDRESFNRLVHDVTTYVLEKVWTGKINEWNGYVTFAVKHFLFGKAEKAYKRKNEVLFAELGGFVNQFHQPAAFPDSNIDGVSMSDMLIGADIMPLVALRILFDVKTEFIDPSVLIYKHRIEFDTVSKPNIFQVEQQDTFNLLFYYLLFKYLAYSRRIPTYALYLMWHYPRLFIETVKQSGDIVLYRNVINAVRRVLFLYMVLSGVKVEKALSHLKIRKNSLLIVKEMLEFLHYLTNANKVELDELREKFNEEIDREFIGSGLLETFKQALESSKELLRKLKQELQEE